MEAAKYTQDDCYIALDVAASEMYEKQADGSAMYRFFKSDKSLKSADEMIEMYAQLVDKYPIISIEDGLGENDWNGWKRLTDRIGNRCQLVGDDVFVTNTSYNFV